MKLIGNYYVINSRVVYFSREHYQLAIFKKHSSGGSFYIRNFDNIKAICHKKLSTRFANKIYRPTIFGDGVQLQMHCNSLEECVNRYLRINKSLSYNVKVLSSYETK